METGIVKLKTSLEIKSEDAQYGEDTYCHMTPGLIYITTSCAGPGADVHMLNSRHRGCVCVETCSFACSCINLSSQTPTQDPSVSTVSQTPIQVPSLVTRLSTGPAFECNEECSCHVNCGNKIVQRGPRRNLVIVSVGRKGLGIRTQELISKGSFICEYAGEYIGIDEARRRFNRMKETDSNYILVLREHFSQEVSKVITIIDPTVLGNLGRYMNHSCEPNAHVIPVRTNSEVPVAAMFALRDIEAGEELCYDYDFSSNGDDYQGASCAKGVKMDTVASDVSMQTKRCLCLSERCRGVLPSNLDIFN